MTGQQPAAQVNPQKAQYAAWALSNLISQTSYEVVNDCKGRTREAYF